MGNNLVNMKIRITKEKIFMLLFNLGLFDGFREWAPETRGDEVIWTPTSSCLERSRRQGESQSRYPSAFYVILSNPVISDVLYLFPHGSQIVL